MTIVLKCITWGSGRVHVGKVSLVGALGVRSREGKEERKEVWVSEGRAMGEF